MTGASAGGVTRHDNESVVAALVVAKWLRLAAAPAFTIMALLTVGFDSGPPNAVCWVAGHSYFGGMAPMYLLMGVFHSAPWLDLISRRRNMEQKR